MMISDIMAQSNKALEVPIMASLRQQVPAPPNESTRYIALTQGQFTLVDAGDYDWLNQWLWCARWNKGTKSFYAVRNAPAPARETILMHRQIAGLIKGDGREADHWNHNTLDNRRINIRDCSVAQNRRNVSKHNDNKSGYKGVYFYPPTSKWAAMIHVDGKNRYLGYFSEALLAARAYDEAARKNFGEFAMLNFPQE